MEENVTTVVYHLDDEETPYRSKLRKAPDQITLSDFKSLIVNPPKAYKYFFKSEDADFGVVKEEISDDKAKLPTLNGRIEAWLVSVDSSSAHSDTTPSSLGLQANLAKTVKKPCNTYKLGVNNVQHSPAPLSRQRQAVREKFEEESACTSDNESTVAGLPRFSRFDRGLERRSLRQQYCNRARPTSHPRNAPPMLDDGSTFNSEFDNTSMFDSDDDEIGTKASFSTDITSVSRQFLKRKQRHKKRRLARPVTSKASAVSSVTESSASLNIITVVLNIDRGGYLGISIVGHSDYPNGDGGIYVATVMKGGAVALDGRIEPNDMILQVNDQPFHNLSNDEAVRYLQRVVKEPGPIKLVVAKSFNSRPRCLVDDLDFRQCEPVQPIDPGAWVAHTNALTMKQQQQQHDNVMVQDLQQQQQQHRMQNVHNMLHQNANIASCSTTQPPPFDYAVRRPASAATASSNNSGSFTGTTIAEDKEPKLDLNVHNMQTIVRYMSATDSGLEIKTRNWLKIEIPDAFMGSNLVDWLLNRVHGFSDRKDARKYAAQMLKENYIRHTVNKYTFTEQCYYVFNNLADNFAEMSLGNDCVQSDPDTLPMLPPPPSMTHTPSSSSWPSNSMVPLPTLPPPPAPLLASQPPPPTAPTQQLGVGNLYSPLPTTMTPAAAVQDLPTPSPVVKPSTASNAATSLSMAATGAAPQPPASSVSGGSAASSSCYSDQRKKSSNTTAVVPR